MANAVIPEPNPSFQVGPITTQSQSVVRRSRVEVFTTVPQSYTGLGANSSLQTTAYIDLASNEEFLDIQKSVFKFDVTFTSSAVEGVCLQQGAESFVYYLSIGSATGLKLEEIQNYNQLAATIEYFTRAANAVEHHMMDRTDYNFVPYKVNGRQGLFDAPHPLVVDSYFECGRTYQVLLRLHQSSLLSSMRYIPLFLLRNGLRIMITFDNAYRITYNPIHADESLDVSVPLSGQYRPSHLPVIVGIGPDALNGTQVPMLIAATNEAVTHPIAGTTAAIPLAADGTAAAQGWNYYPPFGSPFATESQYATAVQIALPSRYRYGLQQRISTSSGTGTDWQFLPVHNVLWLRKNVFTRVMRGWGMESPRASDGRYSMIHFPVSVMEGQQMIWSGFASTVLVGPHDHSAWEIGGPTKSITKNGSAFTTATAANAFTSALSRMNFRANLMNAHSDQWFATNDATSAAAAINYSMMTYIEPNDTDIKLMRFRPLADGATSYTAEADDADWKSIGTNLPASSQSSNVHAWYYGFALYSYGAEQCNVPLCAFGADGTTSTVNLLTANQALANNGGRYIFHTGDYVVTNHTFTRTANVVSGAAAFTGFAVDESSVKGQLYNYLKTLTVVPSARKLTYQIDKFGMILDLVKPDSGTFMEWQKKFIDNSGINYGVTDITYRESQISVKSGMVQVTLPIHKRSLNRLLFTMRDFNFGTGECANVATKFFFATLKSYQRRGLINAKLIIGGQQYPVYDLAMRKENGSFQEYNHLHLLELEQVFGVSGSASFNPSCTLQDLDPGRRNYLGCGAIRYTQTSELASAINANVVGTQTLTVNGVPKSRINTMYYRDAACFIFGFNLARINGDFSSGIDTTQAGSVQLQMNFATELNEFSSYFSNTNFLLDCWAFSDGLVTLNNISNLKRS